jgi:glycosyltransferase involved in cell wall biosynthesis
MSAKSETVAGLCVTYKRLPFLKQAIGCFLQQTHVPRKLVIVHGADDAETSQFLASHVNDPRIRCIRVESTRRIPLGELRNISVRHSEAPLIAQWDDDDWHAPRRLELQVKALRKARHADACILQRWMIYDARSRKVYLSTSRYWEASIVAWREKLPEYPPLRRSEDTAVVDQLVQRDAVVLLDRPELYVYTFHGGNTWNARHWDRNIFAHAAEADPADSDLVRAKLGDHLNDEKLVRVQRGLADRLTAALRSLLKKNGRT